jgi:hypothetical protein
MRPALCALAALMATACKGPDATAPTTGTLSFQIETATCSTEGSFAVELFIDHVNVGTPTMSIGTLSSYTVAAGTHTVGAIAVDGRFNWGYVSVVVPAGGEYTTLLECQSP